MKTTLCLVLVLLVKGLTVHCMEDLSEETTIPGFTDQNPVSLPDYQPSPNTADTKMKPNILKELEHVAWKLVQLELDVSSAIQKRLGEPLVNAIRMRSQAQLQPALTRIIGLVEGSLLGNSLQERK